MKKILITLLLFPLLTFAQTGGELSVGEQTITYDTSTEIDSGVLFYLEDVLVASEHGVVMLVYQDDQVVLEAHDISGDGEYDTFLTLNEAGEVTKMEGEGVSAFERPEPVEFDDLLAESGGAGEAGTPDEDLVGSLDSITIPGSGKAFWFPIFLVISIVAGWWYFRGKNKDEGD